MTEAEAHRVAEAIRCASLHEVYVEAIEQDPETGRFWVRCRYIGPTFYREQQLFLHGMSLRIETSYGWRTLFKLLKG